MKIFLIGMVLSFCTSVNFIHSTLLMNTCLQHCEVLPREISWNVTFSVDPPPLSVTHGCSACRLQHSVKRPKQEPDLSSKSAQSPGGHQFGSKRQDNTPSPQLQPHDPYEFSDEASSNAGSFRKRGFRNSRDDSFPRSSPFTSRQVCGFVYAITQFGMTVSDIR